MSLIASSQLIIVVGLGITGLSAARFLQRQNVKFMVMDSRDNPPNIDTFRQEFPNTVIQLGALDTQLLASATEIILSPGISVTIPELQEAITQGVPIVGDIELFARKVDKPVIAITGSNAKSTVTTLVGQMATASGLRVAVGGNLYPPALDLLTDDVDLFVLELSSFQLETTFSLKPTVASILNISPDHMDRYASLAAYHQAKQRVYRHAECYVINRQDALTHPPLAKDSNVISFGSDRPDRHGFGIVTHNGEQYLAYEFEKLIPVSQLPLKGKHNYVNALSALALGFAMGFEREAMLSALKQFSGLEHRCEYVATIDEVMYINDSKGTNVGATVTAINSFCENQNIILIAGGDGKGADFSPLADVVKQCVRLAILIGEDADKIQKVITGKTEIQHADTLNSALTIAKETAQKGDVVLLSPACTSLDMFANYQERGKQFVADVKGVCA